MNRKEPPTHTVLLEKKKNKINKGKEKNKKRITERIRKEKERNRIK